MRPLKIRRILPKPKGYKVNPETLADHLIKRRQELHLYQKDAAQLMGINQSTLINWEQNRAEPEIRMMPKIIKFLGYYPYPQPQTFTDRLVEFRRYEGLSRKRFAAKLGVDPETVSKWENGVSPSLPSHLAVLVKLGLWPKDQTWPMDDN